MNVMRFQRNVAASETIALRGDFGRFLANYDGVDADDRCNIGGCYTSCDNFAENRHV
jgi:hypothetical protein